MQSIRDQLSNRNPRVRNGTDGIKGPRHELIVRFTDRINAQRKAEAQEKGASPKLVPYVAIASKLKHIRNQQTLYAFYQDCERARHFSAYFFWSLKPANINKTN